MLNLLTKPEKKKIIREYRVRFWVVAFSLALAGEVISLILLIPPYLSAQSRLNLLDSQSVGLQAQNLTSESSSLGAVVRQTNAYLNAFNSSSTPTGVVKVMQDVVGVKGNSVRFKSLFYKPGNGKQRILISGNANSRQSLLDFDKNIKSLPDVVSVDLPVSNFAQSKDINFSVDILIDPQKK